MPFDRYMNEMADFFEEFSVEKEEDARDICRNIQRIIRIGGQIGDIMNYLENDLVMIDETVFPQFAEILMRVWNHTRMQMNRGYMPDEMSCPESVKKVKEKAAGMGFQPLGDTPGGKADIIDFQEERRKKIYPNDTCPCGSGKKYKHCCGKKK